MPTIPSAVSDQGMRRIAALSAAPQCPPMAKDLPAFPFPFRIRRNNCGALVQKDVVVMGQPAPLDGLAVGGGGRCLILPCANQDGFGSLNFAGRADGILAVSPVSDWWEQEARGRMSLLRAFCIQGRLR
jgi:hypothetical protein